MLLIGDDGLNENQAEAQLGLWALFPAPLLMSNDLRIIDDKFKRILLNKEVIAINQDPLGKPGHRVFHNESLDVWVRELQSNSYAFGVLNRRATSGPKTVKVQLAQLGIPKGSYNLRDAIRLTDIAYNPNEHEYLELDVPPTGLRLIKVTPTT